MKRALWARRGEATTIVLIAVAVTALVVSVLPSLNPFKALSGGGQNAAKQEASWTKTSEKPVILSSPQVPGQAVVAYERTYDTGQEVKTPKLTLGQRIGNFFDGLATWAVIGVILLVLAGVVTPAGIFAWIARRFKNALKNTVAAIRETDDDTFQKLKPHLAARQDKKDKVMIDKIKSELH